ncbi:MAG: DUF523 domain-containing protein [Erysipelotrichaceae bacterium]|nr:DUF523 domain-containing protein [Erysipelotrichaceae bacterium]
MKEKVAVSACLVGKNTKYNGKNNYNEAVMKYLQDKEYILICPEVMGGLSTPRLASERKDDKVFNMKNEDVSKYFINGAKIALDEIKKGSITTIIVKENSPSCGLNYIYDGSFSHKLVKGQGVFVEMLSKEKVKIYSEKDIEELID